MWGWAGPEVEAVAHSPLCPQDCLEKPYLSSCGTVTQQQMCWYWALLYAKSIRKVRQIWADSYPNLCVLQPKEIRKHSYATNNHKSDFALVQLLYVRVFNFPACAIWTQNLNWILRALRRIDFPLNTIKYSFMTTTFFPLQITWVQRNDTFSSLIL